MARLPRLVVPGQAHHLVQRGHNAQPVFIDDEDRRQYLTALRDALRAHEVVLHAYALLDGAVQLLLRPPSESALSRMVQALGRRYVAGFNRRHGRSGTIWEGRFRAGVVQQGQPTLQSVLMIDALPQDRRWSSAPHRLGLARDPLVSDPPEYWQLGNTPFEREAAYRQRQAEGLSAHQISALAAASHKGWPLGDASWLANLALRTQRPLAPRPRGRPARPRVD